MGAAIWSTDPARMLAFPARFFVRFLHRHGMLSVNDRPQWRVVCGGSARYVERLVAPWRDRIRLNCPVERLQRTPAGVLVTARGAGVERYDEVFLACHADQALRLLADPSPAERAILGAMPYQPNEAILHTDASLLPRARRAWAAWNYHVPARPQDGVALTYNMNILQRLRSRHTFCVTLNRSELIDPSRVLARVVYHHPLFTPQSVAAQGRHAEISGVRHTHYCGAYWRCGFHEDGVASALQAVRRFEEHDAQRDLSRVA
jgi:predicted NAD/FAD-binding protein